MQQASQLVSHVDHHHLLAGAGQVGDLGLDGLGHVGVDGAAQATVRSHADEQMLGGLVLRRFDLGLLVQRCGAERSNVSLVETRRRETEKKKTEAGRTESAGAVDSGRLQLPLSTGVLGGGHHLHGLGDFLDVLDGLQPNGDCGEERTSLSEEQSGN